MKFLAILVFIVGIILILFIVIWSIASYFGTEQRNFTYRYREKASKILVLLWGLITIILAIMAGIAQYSIHKYGNKSKYYQEDLPLPGQSWDQAVKNPKWQRSETFVTTAKLNLRDKPSLRGRIIHILSKGEGIAVRSPTWEKGDWLLVETIDLKYKGYVNKKYLVVADKGLSSKLMLAYFGNISLKLIKDTISLWNLFSMILAGIISAFIYLARRKNRNWMELITMGVSVSIYAVSRRFFYGMESLELFGIEYWIFFIYHCIIGFITWKLTYFLILTRRYYG